MQSTRLWLPTISTWILFARLVYLITVDLVQRPLRRREYDDVFEEESTGTLAARSEAVVVPSAAVGLGFHSGFLDDDEPSAVLSPKYRDEPDSARTVRMPRSGRDES